MCLAMVMLFFLSLICTGAGLSLRRFRDQPLKREPNASHGEMGEWVPNVTDFSSNARGILHANQSNQYCGCEGSSCFINAKKLKAEFQNQLILILGCSLDIYAIGFFCNAATGTPPDQIMLSSPMSYLAFCDVGQFTVAYAFHPGASPPPYAPDYNPGVMGTTRDIIAKTKNDVIAKFGRAPAAIIVDASLWDSANWWQKSGWPPYPYINQGTPAYLQQWCNKDVPEILMYVATLYPNTPIAFRTAPTVFSNPNSYGLSAIVIEQMVSCVEQHRDAWGNVYGGGFGLIDYHHFVDTLLQQSAAPSAYYKDSLHPGQLVSMMYMNSMLNWVNQRSHLSGS